MSGKIRKGRKSIFREIGLEDDYRIFRRAAAGVEKNCEKKKEEEEQEEEHVEIVSPPPSEPTRETYRRSYSIGGESSRGKPRWLSKLIPEKRPMIKSAATAPPASGGLHRFVFIALLIAVVLPAIGYTNGRQRKVEVSGADAGVIREPIVRSVLEDRANSPTDVCKRWAGQSAILNGTLYYYGGRVKTSSDQTDDTWSNDFITIDLTKSWDTDSPAISGMPQPSGPPAISLGYLWNDFDHLFLYGGEFDFPSTNPSPVSTWMYDIASSTWTELKDPKTSAGQYSDAGDAPVQRAAEGAGVSVPELGLSWYFGGHLDWATTPGWSNQIPRAYLKSLLEYTHPGYANVQVESLHNAGAPSSGAYRNITWAGEQNQDGFTERADGVLVYVPGWGPGGILLGLGGGVVGDNDTTDAFSSMTTIDVYDIASSQWYHQATSGDAIPRVRANPCAVVFSAPDASSFNIYMYGGQNLLPVGRQEQYADVWILTIPSFSWIQVDPSENGPPARAGHSCAARDGQVVVVGGYIGDDQSTRCERPGIHAFDASGLAWQSTFRAAADRAPDADADNSVLAGSRGYLVPGVVQSVIGGSSAGGATATQPASGPATDGPFKTGVPPVFTITATGSGSTATATATVTNPAGGGTPEPPDNNNKGDGRRDGTIAAGVVAALAGLVALYLGFCAWLWRRQVRAYKRHMAIANGYGEEDDDDNENARRGGIAAGLTTLASEKLRKKDPKADGLEHFSWVGPQSFQQQQQQLHPNSANGSGSSGGGGGLPGPGFLTTSSGEPSPGSGSGSGMIIPTNRSHSHSQSHSHSRSRLSEDRSHLWPYSYDGSSYSYNNNNNNMGLDFSSPGPGPAHDLARSKSEATRSTRSGGSADALLDGREPNFFSVVLGPRRALRVVNGMED